MHDDHDPRALREIATVAKQEVARNWASPNFESLADYILATVREDDGEDQPDVTVTHDRCRVRVQRTPWLKSAVWLTIDAKDEELNIPLPSFTRGQFRDLCRGLGIIEPTRE